MLSCMEMHAGIAEPCTEVVHRLVPLTVDAPRVKHWAQAHVDSADFGHHNDLTDFTEKSKKHSTSGN